jgi:hypothetical protein
MFEDPHHGHRFRESRCLNDDMVDFISALTELLKNTNEIFSHRAAYTTVIEFKDDFIRRSNQRAVYTQVAKLIFDDGESPIWTRSQNMVEQCRFASTKEPCHQRDWYLGICTHCDPLSRTESIFVTHSSPSPLKAVGPMGHSFEPKTTISCHELQVQ